ncbi:MAG: ACT domain-containing protein [Chloroflexi bacterium]|nr:ACT domain-containing protein [Chloroflexota bacterium]
MASIIQFSAVLHNVPGTLSEITRELSYWGVNIKGISVVESEDYSIMRFVVDDPVKAERILKEKSFDYKKTDVIAMRIPHEPGALSRVANLMGDKNINIQYLYLAVDITGNATLIVKFDKTESARLLLCEAGIEMPEPDEL